MVANVSQMYTGWNLPVKPPSKSYFYPDLSGYFQLRHEILVVCYWQLGIYLTLADDLIVESITKISGKISPLSLL